MVGSTKILHKTARMGYNKRNFIDRVVYIQEVTLENTKRGVTQEWVYANIIFPEYRISRRTYYSYLAMPAKKIKRELI